MEGGVIEVAASRVSSIDRRRPSATGPFGIASPRHCRLSLSGILLLLLGRREISFCAAVLSRSLTRREKPHVLEIEGAHCYFLPLFLSRNRRSFSSLATFPIGPKTCVR